MTLTLGTGPFGQTPAVDRICFLDVEIDGEAQERPVTPFSPR